MLNMPMILDYNGTFVGNLREPQSPISHQQIPQSLLNRHTHNIWFKMSRDHTFFPPLEDAPSLFHMNPLLFYLDKLVFGK
jgi:hypothetical protein